MPRFLSIRWKLLLSLTGLVVGVVALVLIGVTTQVRSRIVADVHERFVEKGRLFERLQQTRFRQLRQTAILLADAPSLKAAVSTGDAETVSAKIREELLPLLDVDPLLPDSTIPEAYFADPDSAGLVVVTDPSGYPIGQMATGALPRFSIAERPGVAEALLGGYPERATIWQQNGRYFSVATVPIWLGPSVLGTLSYGHPIRAAEADQLARDLQNEVAFFVDDRILASSFGPMPAAEAERLARAIHTATYTVARDGTAATFELDLRGDVWTVYVAPMLPEASDAHAIPGYFAVARSYTAAVAPLRRLQLTIFLLGGVAVLLAAGVALVLTKRITRPIEELVTGIRHLEQGEYAYEVPVVSNDELGLLTRTFNTLVAHLRERLEMLKFVSRATLDAISDHLNTIDRSGDRREMTVLFSDIRSFTAWSEKRPPEEVIELLNACLRVQAEAVEQHGGDIDKFVGDEVVALFSGPNRDRNAVEAAVAMQRAVLALEGTRSAGLSVGIGINSGPVVMGAIGSASRMDYTAIGNHVNLGARLCAAAAPGQILLTDAVAAHLERRIPLRPVPPVHAKGIAEPVAVYEVVWQDAPEPAPHDGDGTAAEASPSPEPHEV